LQTRAAHQAEAAADPPRLDNVTSPPLDVLALAPRSYNALISDAKEDLAQVPELDFMRGRVVIFVGDRCVWAPCNLNPVICARDLILSSGPGSVTTARTLKDSARCTKGKAQS
jgi:hypothetical protein